MRTQTQVETMSKDTKCKQTGQRIDRTICRNNCKEWNRKKKKCERGYNFK